MKKMTKNNQRGMTFIGLVLVIAAVLFLAVIGMKVVPAYLEFNSVKNAIKKAVASVGTSDKNAVIATFKKYAEVDNIAVVSGKDLVFTGDTVSVDYQVVVPIAANASVLLDFSATSAK
jgi:Tfp pilus assembly protein PilE